MDDFDSRMFRKTIEEMDLMTRHIKMLKVTKANQPIGIMHLSEILGIPSHKVRYSLRMLEKEGLIVATPDGATVSDKYDPFMETVPKHLMQLEQYISKMREELSGL